ncbi:MAG: MarR family winged helix-turn-helix transcriptional regulator [Burkholderiaceae bacterium]|nr:MarR family winged helix-turn-helix transcriptional regulator [Burkholderiaceae bacterium]
MSEPGENPDPLGQPQALADLLLYRLSVITRTSGLPMVRLFEGEFGMTRRHWHILALVVEHGGLAASQLADLCWLDRPQVSRAVAGLRAQGLVEPGPGSARGRLLVVTPTGQARYRHALARVAHFNAELVSVLDPSERQQLDGLLQRLQQRVKTLAAEAAAQVPPARRSRRSG